MPVFLSVDYYMEDCVQMLNFIPPPPEKKRRREKDDDEVGGEQEVNFMFT